MIYLASPYSHPDPFVREERYLRALKVLTEQFLAKQKWAYSPIVHCHHLAVIGNLPKNAEFWNDYNRHMLCLSWGLAVLRIDGWEKSVGVKMEIEWANKFGKPVTYI